MTLSFREYYKLGGKSHDIAVKFHQERDQAIKTCRKLADEFGAVSAYANSGKMFSMEFSRSVPIPHGWKKTCDNGFFIECEPDLRTKEGKEIAEKLKNAPIVEDYNLILPRIDKSIAREVQIDRRKMLIPTCQRIAFPAEAYLVSIPRVIDDGLQIPKDWEEISERDYTYELHIHNLLAGQKKASTSLSQEAINSL